MPETPEGIKEILAKNRQDKEYQIENIPVDQLVPNEWNPNYQKDEEFAALCENIPEIGFVQPVLVTKKEDKYLILDGEHRYRACAALGRKTIPCVILDEGEFDEDIQKLITVRMGIIKGRYDPVAFTQLYNEVSKKYGKELSKALMKFTDERAFEKMYLDVRKSLPPNLRKKLDKKKKEKMTVEGLSEVVNQIMTEEKDKAEKNGVLVFDLMGKKHRVWMILNPEVENLIIDWEERALAEGRKISDVFYEEVIKPHLLPKDITNSE